MWDFLPPILGWFYCPPRNSKHNKAGWPVQTSITKVLVQLPFLTSDTQLRIGELSFQNKVIGHTPQPEPVLFLLSLLKSHIRKPHELISRANECMTSGCWFDVCLIKKIFIDVPGKRNFWRSSHEPLNPASSALPTHCVLRLRVNQAGPPTAPVAQSSRRLELRGAFPGGWAAVLFSQGLMDFPRHGNFGTQARNWDV